MSDLEADDLMRLYRIALFTVERLEKELESYKFNFEDREKKLMERDAELLKAIREVELWRYLTDNPISKALIREKMKAMYGYTDADLTESPNSVP